MPVQFSPVVPARHRPLAGFRSLQFVDLDKLGVAASPLAVLDDFRVSEMPFSAHPHAGFAAVTYIFEDSETGVRSRTSFGADLVAGPGGIVWTHAGSGVIHEEVPAQRGRELHGLQLFVNLTSKNKLSPAQVLALQPDEVPEWRSGTNGRVRVVVGSFEGASSPLVPKEPFSLLDVELGHQVSYATEAGSNTVIYVVDGSLFVAAGPQLERLSAGQALALSHGAEVVSLESADRAHFLVFAGRAIHEPVVEEGPFIMNDRSQIEAAIARYHSGEMGGLSPR